MKDKIDGVLSAVREAGAAILGLQSSDMSVSLKDNNDIVTQGDMLANDILKKELSALFPKAGWLSEESADDLSRLSDAQVFIVDPIDGTREYAKGMPEYAISVALVEQGQPIISVVFNPATGELFHAIKGQGAWLNGESIRCQDTSQAPLVVLASRSEYKRGEWDKFKPLCEVIQIGSIAYKLALVAAGRAHATFSLGPKSEWDIAAGVLLVLEAGGQVSTKFGEQLAFNQSQVRVNSIVATAKASHETIFSMIGAL